MEGNLEIMRGLRDISTYKGTYLQNRNRLTVIENKLMVTKVERGRGGIN